MTYSDTLLCVNTASQNHFYGCRLFRYAGLLIYESIPSRTIKFSLAVELSGYMMTQSRIPTRFMSALISFRHAEILGRCRTKGTTSLAGGHKDRNAVRPRQKWHWSPTFAACHFLFSPMFPVTFHCVLSHKKSCHWSNLKGKMPQTEQLRHKVMGNYLTEEENTQSQHGHRMRRVRDADETLRSLGLCAMCHITLSL